MNGYLSLDSWVLEEYSKPEKLDQLDAYLRDGGLVGVINPLTLVEIYNPGWRNRGPDERGARIAGLLSKIPCAITDLVNVIRHEFLAYPQPLDQLPVKLNLADVTESLREETLLRFLRADPIFLDQGKDIRAWDANRKRSRQRWLTNVEEIIADGIKNGHLVRSPKGVLIASAEGRDGFLQALDFRHILIFNSAERRALGPKIVELYLGETRRLPAVRMSSLLFLYQYVDIDPSQRPKLSGSDLSDFVHLSIAPYCAAVTADRAMKRLLERIRPEFQLDCRVLDAADLREAIS